MQFPDANKITGLIERHGSALVLYARGLCDQPDDVVQEAFIQLIKSDAMPVQPASWLFRVVRNLALNRLRSTSRRKRYEKDYASNSQAWFETKAEDKAIANEAVEALQRLPDDQRETVVARIWGQLSFEQIADLTGCSVSTTHRRYTGALEKLELRLSKPLANKNSNGKN